MGSFRRCEERGRCQRRWLRCVLPARLTCRRGQTPRLQADEFCRVTLTRPDAALDAPGAVKRRVGEQCGLWRCRIGRRHASLLIPPADRNQSLRHDHHDQGRHPPEARAPPRPHHPVLVRGRPYRCSRARTPLRGEMGVEGFSEVLASEVALIGVHVKVIEPGGFRTDFAGSSTHVDEGRPGMTRWSAPRLACSVHITAGSPAIRARAQRSSLTSPAWPSRLCAWPWGRMRSPASRRPTGSVSTSLLASGR